MVAALRLASPGERVATVPTFFFHASPSRTLDNTAGPYTPSDARTLDNVPSLARCGFHAPSIDLFHGLFFVVLFCRQPQWHHRGSSPSRLDPVIKMSTSLNRLANVSRDVLTHGIRDESLCADRRGRDNPACVAVNDASIR